MLLKKEQENLIYDLESEVKQLKRKLELQAKQAKQWEADLKGLFSKIKSLELEIQQKDQQIHWLEQEKKD